MKKSTLLLIILALFSSINLYSQLQPAQTGMKLFDDYSPDKTGSTDVSDLLQTAADWCVANNKTLFISSGTYLVTKQITVNTMTGQTCGYHDGKFAFIVTGDAFNHPVIKLIDGAVGFQSTAIGSASPVIIVQHHTGDSGESCVYWSQIKNLDFDLGNNPGAVAVKLAGAQDTQLSNIKVYGQDFAAGFTGVPGRNSGTFNCEVTGGKYAFYINNSLGATLYGIRCINQSVAALYLAIWRGPAIVGLEISGCSGTAVICRNTATAQVNNKYYQGHLSLTDASIELSNSANFAFDIADRGLSLQNIYINGTNNLVKSNSGNWTESFTAWGRIKKGNFFPTNINSFATFNVTDNEKNTTTTKEFETALNAPTNFITKNTPPVIYAFNSQGAVSVATYGASPSATAAVNYNAIQKAINENNIVFIPAGNYSISAPLLLKNNSVLLGDPGKRSQLTPAYTPATHTWMVTTPDIDGYCVIQDLAFDNPDKAYCNAIKWQTSNGFILNVRNYLAAGCNEKAKKNYYFTGHAGGKFFSILDHASLYDTQLSPSPDYHKVIVESNLNPITFYGLNLERGGNAGEVPQNPYADFINAKNIRVFGTKSETDGLVYRLTNCDNISLNFIMAHAHIANLVDSKIIGIYGTSTNIDVNIVLCPYTTTAGLTMIDDDFSDLVKRDNYLGNYKIGTFDPTVFYQNDLTTLNDQYYDRYFVYPSVTKGLLNITGTEKIKQIKLIGSSGMLVKKWSNESQIDISDVFKGIYSIQMIDNYGMIYCQKIIKQ